MVNERTTFGRSGDVDCNISDLIDIKKVKEISGSHFTIIKDVKDKYSPVFLEVNVNFQQVVISIWITCAHFDIFRIPHQMVPFSTKKYKAKRTKGSQIWNALTRSVRGEFWPIKMLFVLRKPQPFASNFNHFEKSPTIYQTTLIVITTLEECWVKEPVASFTLRKIAEHANRMR